MPEPDPPEPDPEVMEFPTPSFLNLNQGLFLAGISGLIYLVILLSMPDPEPSTKAVTVSALWATLPFLGIVYRLLGD